MTRMRPVTAVHVDIARLTYEVGKIRDDAELGAWVRSLIDCLCLREPSLNQYGAYLLDEVSEYRKADSARKTPTFPEDSAGFRGIPSDSVDSQPRASRAKQAEQTEQEEKDRELAQPALLPRGQKPARPRFVKPNYDEVQEYCRERRNGIDPAHFLAHYESNGWKVGRNPMSNWKATIVTWEKREREKPLKVRMN